MIGGEIEQVAENYTPLPDEWLDEMGELADAEYGRLIRWYQTLKITGAAEKLNGNERFYTKRCENTLKRFNDAAQKRSDDASEAARIRWERERQKDATACEGMQPHASGCEGMRNDATSTSSNTVPSPNKPPKGGNKRTKFIPPTLEEVRAYARERNSGVDPEHFFNYFNEGNWKDSKGNSVRNWKQKFMTWEKYNTPAVKDPYAEYDPNDPFAGWDEL